VHISTQIAYDDNSFLKKAFEASGVTFGEVVG
jgi:hypothetical protein